MLFLRLVKDFNLSNKSFFKKKNSIINSIYRSVLTNLLEYILMLNIIIRKCTSVTAVLKNIITGLSKIFKKLIRQRKQF